MRLDLSATTNSSMTSPSASPRWDTRARNKAQRIERARALADGKIIASGDATAFLEAILEPGDRVCIEGDNQKHADYLAEALANEHIATKNPN